MCNRQANLHCVLITSRVTPFNCSIEVCEFSYISTIHRYIYGSPGLYLFTEESEVRMIIMILTDRFWRRLPRLALTTNERWYLSSADAMDEEIGLRQVSDSEYIRNMSWAYFRQLVQYLRRVSVCNNCKVNQAGASRLRAFLVRVHQGRWTTRRCTVNAVMAAANLGKLKKAELKKTCSDEPANPANNNTACLMYYLHCVGEVLPCRHYRRPSHGLQELPPFVSPGSAEA